MADSLGALHTSLNSLTNVVFDNWLALAYILAEQGGVCAVINQTYYIYINNSGIVETNTKKIYDQAECLHRYNK